MINLNFLVQLLTYLFVGIIIVIWVYFQFINKNTSIRKTYAPSILTSIGIFGTFFGIAVGLSGFNVEDIQNSVPLLINGLKTAFWSSIAGLLGSLLIKFTEIRGLKNIKSNSKPIAYATINDLMSQLIKITDCLVGDDDSTLLSQLKISRLETNDSLKEIKSSLSEFLTNMAEQNSETLIKALEEVMKDFNSKINEQFGDNFKRLNRAVGKLLDWQANYKNQLDDLIAVESKTAENMEIATNKFSELLKKAEIFTETASSLNDLLTGFDTLKDKISKDFNNLSNIQQLMQKEFPDLNNKIQDMINNITSAFQMVSNEFSNKIGELTESITNATNNNAESMINTLNEVNSNFNQHIDDIANKTRRQVFDLDQALEKELTKSLESFGQQLTALSNKFVEDYLPLTEKLKEVVNISRGI